MITREPSLPWRFVLGPILEIAYNTRMRPSELIQKSALVLLCLAAIFSGASAGAITIATVPVRDPGNPSDPATGNVYGSVSYEYSIGTTEVTVGQYTAFLNSVATTDTYGLYTTYMQTGAYNPCITRSGTSGSYAYSVIGSANHPVTYVSWGNAARFANWLHNGQPTTHSEDASTTEDGAYTLNGATSKEDLSTVSRNINAKWFIPSENEWYKAAYYHPAVQGGDTDNYWDYPMRTNSAPYSDQPPGATPDNSRVGNFYREGGQANSYNNGYAATGTAILSVGQNQLTDVGAYTSSASFYGTFDQGGNLLEWNEAIIGSSSHGLRGGAWASDWWGLSASIQGNFEPPAGVSDVIGFRVATQAIPEPSMLILLLVVSIVCTLVRNQRSCKALRW
jgi:formylglycine-generating enzyme